jgi:peptidoglycan/LPS O-acetylase OafA/YrhL
MRNPSLDILRAIGVVLVFCYHSEGAGLVARFGWTGVDLFFVLSGLLVSGLLFREYQVTSRVRGAGRAARKVIHSPLGK